jgi:hypothetical protein
VHAVWRYSSGCYSSQYSELQSPNAGTLQCTQYVTAYSCYGCYSMLRFRTSVATAATVHAVCSSPSFSRRLSLSRGVSEALFVAAPIVQHGGSYVEVKRFSWQPQLFR